jgi:hypothetical protein
MITSEFPEIDIEPVPVPLNQIPTGGTFYIGSNPGVLFQRSETTCFLNNGGEIPAGNLLVSCLNNGTQQLLGESQVCFLVNVKISLA